LNIYHYIFLRHQFKRRQGCLIFYSGVAPGGVYTKDMSPYQLVGSYPTFSPLPFSWRLFSVALFLESLPLDVI